MSLKIDVEPCPKCKSSEFFLTIKYNKEDVEKHRLSAAVICARCDYRFDYILDLNLNITPFISLYDLIDPHNKATRAPKQLPCPFCGSTNLDIEYVPANEDDEGYYHPNGYCKIYCRKCGSSTMQCHSYEDALEKWNNRAGDKHVRS